VPQLGKFINSIKNNTTVNEIVKTLYDVLTGDEVTEANTKKLIGSGEIYKFVSELVSKPPIITVIIENKTEALDEVLDAINHPQKKVIEFQTFRRVGEEVVHAYLFEPLSGDVEGEIGEKVLLSELREDICERRPDIKTYKPTDRYGKISLGHVGLHLEWLFRDAGELGVELHMARPTSNANTKLIKELEEEKLQIEKSVGQKLVFEENWGKKWSRIYVTKEINETPDFKEWAIATMIMFYDTFKPLLDKMDSA
jgi:uncharacterized protein YbcI